MRTTSMAETSRENLPSTSLLSRVKTQDYVMPVAGEELLYTTSQVYPRQLSVLNTTAQVGVVVDSENERLAVFNGETGRGVVIDKHLGMGIQIDKGGWTIYGSSFQDYLKDTNLTDLIEKNSENVFQLDDQDNTSDATVFVQNTVRRLSPDFLKEIMRDSGKFFKGFLKTFGFIMYPLKEALGPLLNMMTPAWVVFKGGFKALLNIFKWMGKLVSKVVGGLPNLLKNAVVFPLTAIITALDGAKAFFIMIKQLATKFDLMAILKIFTNPEKIVKFIVGLGGKMLKGMTGVFSLVLRLFTFSLYSIASAVRSLTEMLLNFLRGRRPSYENVKQSADELLTIPKVQEERFHNGAQFGEYNNFMQGFKGEGDYKVHGVNVGGFVKAITKTTETAKVVVMTAMKQLSPIIPFSDSLPQLLVNMVKSLNTTKGASYVETLIPSVTIPKGGLESIHKNIQAELAKEGSSEESLSELRNLPPPALLRKLPVVGQIYSELDDAARTYHNSSLDSMLRNHHTEELMEFTTKAFGLVR